MNARLCVVTCTYKMIISNFQTGNCYCYRIIYYGLYERSATEITSVKLEHQTLIGRDCNIQFNDILINVTLFESGGVTGLTFEVTLLKSFSIESRRSMLAFALYHTNHISFHIIPIKLELVVAKCLYQPIGSLKR